MDLDLDIDGVAHGGVFVGRFEGRVVFVPDAIPGERMRVRVVDDSKPSFWRAEALEVLEASPHRRARHIQPEASLDRPIGLRAGGADFGHIELGHQRELKQRVLEDALRRQGRLGADALAAFDLRVQPIAGERADGSGWRTRMRLHVDARGALGMLAPRSHTVVPIESMPLATDRIQAALDDAGFEGAQTVDAVDAGSGIRIVVDGRGSREPIVERVAGRGFRLDELGFWQVHRGAAARLCEVALATVDPDRFDPAAANLDLYGGVGLFAAAIATRFGGPDGAASVTTVESDARASVHAAANLADLAGATAVQAEVLRFLRGTPQRGGTVLLDPPRSGAGRAVIDSLVNRQPAQIVYVACDPVALSRDIAFLAGHGWRLDALSAHDLFPNTHHLEAVARFVPASG